MFRFARTTAERSKCESEVAKMIEVEECKRREATRLEEVLSDYGKVSEGKD